MAERPGMQAARINVGVIAVWRIWGGVGWGGGEGSRPGRGIS